MNPRSDRTTSWRSSRARSTRARSAAAPSWRGRWRSACRSPPATRCSAPIAPALRTSAENPITVTVGGTPIAVDRGGSRQRHAGRHVPLRPGADSDNLDPVTNDGNVNIWYFMSIYDQLVRVAPDGISLVPGLAESWDISDDGMTYTFHLRPNVLFSDGTPMTSADVLYSWVRAANDPSQHWTFTLTALKRDADGQVEGITRAGRHHRRRRAGAAVGAVPLRRRHVQHVGHLQGVRRRATRSASHQECMGTGPFALDEWSKGEFLTPGQERELLGGRSAAARRGRRHQSCRTTTPASCSSRAASSTGMMDVPFSRVPELQARPEPEGLPVPVDLDTLHHPQRPRGAARRRPRAARAAVRHRPADAGRRRPLRDRHPGDDASCRRARSTGTTRCERYPYDLDKAQEELAQSATPDGFPLELQDRWPAAPTTRRWRPRSRTCGARSASRSRSRRSKQASRRGLPRTRTSRRMTNYWTNDIIDPDELVGLRRPPGELPRRSTPAGTMRRRRNWRARARPKSIRPSARRSTSASRRSTTRNRR